MRHASASLSGSGSGLQIIHKPTTDTDTNPHQHRYTQTKPNQPPHINNLPCRAPSSEPVDQESPPQHRTERAHAEGLLRCAGLRAQAAYRGELRGRQACRTRRGGCCTRRRGARDRRGGRAVRYITCAVGVQEVSVGGGEAGKKEEELTGRTSECSPGSW